MSSSRLNLSDPTSNNLLPGGYGSWYTGTPNFRRWAATGEGDRRTSVRDSKYSKHNRIITDTVNEVLHDDGASVTGEQEAEIIPEVQRLMAEKGLEVSRSEIEAAIELSTEHGLDLVRLRGPDGPIADGRIFNPIVKRLSESKHGVWIDRLVKDVTPADSDLHDGMNVLRNLRIMAENGYVQIKDDLTVELAPKLVYKSWEDFPTLMANVDRTLERLDISRTERPEQTSAAPAPVAATSDYQHHYLGADDTGRPRGVRTGNALRLGSMEDSPLISSSRGVPSGNETSRPRGVRTGNALRLGSMEDSPLISSSRGMSSGSERQPTTYRSPLRPQPTTTIAARAAQTGDEDEDWQLPSFKSKTYGDYIKAEMARLQAEQPNLSRRSAYDIARVNWQTAPENFSNWTSEHQAAVSAAATEWM